jgi:hypothetical protein
MSSGPTQPPEARSPSATPAPTAPPPVTIHEAELASGPSGGVIRCAVIDVAAAVARRQRGENVVVCGDDLKANRRQAEQIEAAVGPYLRSAPHRQSAGRRALPHFQQQDEDHEGHTFYETPNLRAMRRKA